MLKTKKVNENRTGQLLSRSIQPLNLQTHKKKKLTHTQEMVELFFVEKWFQWTYNVKQASGFKTKLPEVTDFLFFSFER